MKRVVVVKKGPPLAWHNSTGRRYSDVPYK